MEGGEQKGNALKNVKEGEDNDYGKMRGKISSLIDKGANIVNSIKDKLSRGEEDSGNVGGVKNNKESSVTPKAVEEVSPQFEEFNAEHRVDEEKNAIEVRSYGESNIGGRARNEDAHGTKGKISFAEIGANGTSDSEKYQIMAEMLNNVKFVNPKTGEEESFQTSGESIKQLEENLGSYLAEGKLGSIDFVADGAGGEGNGEEASSIAGLGFSYAIAEAVSQGEDITQDTVREAVMYAHNLIVGYNLQDDKKKGASTFIASVTNSKGQTYVASVGDSRVYKQDSEGNVVRITEDQSPMEGWVQNERKQIKVEKRKENREFQYHESFTDIDKIWVSKQLGGRVTEELRESDIQIYGMTVDNQEKLFLVCDGVWEGINLADKNVNDVLQEASRKYKTSLELKVSPLLAKNFADGFVFKEVNLKGTEGMSAEELSKHLTRREVGDWSRDNVTAVVVEKSNKVIQENADDKDKEVVFDEMHSSVSIDDDVEKDNNGSKINGIENLTKTNEYKGCRLTWDRPEDTALMPYHMKDMDGESVPYVRAERIYRELEKSQIVNEGSTQILLGFGSQDRILEMDRFSYRPTASLYSIFSGFGWQSSVSDYAKQDFESFVRMSLRGGSSSVQEALSDSFTGMHEYMRSLRKINKESGSSALVAFVTNKKLYIANAGDSRAVIGSEGKAIRLSKDHTPDDPEERQRIESTGKKVTKTAGDIYRVNDVLPVSRALGYYEAEVSPEPTIKTYELEGKKERLILASKTLWNVMSDQDALDLIKDTSDSKKASEVLAQKAKELGSKGDISVIVVDFK